MKKTNELGCLHMTPILQQNTVTVVSNDNWYMKKILAFKENNKGNVFCSQIQTIENEKKVKNLLDNRGYIKKIAEDYIHIRNTIVVGSDKNEEILTEKNIQTIM